MDNVDTIHDFQNPPIITLGDELQGILGINSTDSSIFTDILLNNKEKEDELDLEIERLLNSPKAQDTNDDSAEFLVPDLVTDAWKALQSVSPPPSPVPYEPVNLASEYESLARSVFAPSPAPVLDETKKYACSLCPKRFRYQRYLNKHFSKHTNRFTCPHCEKSFARKESKIKHLPRCKVVDPECRRRKNKTVSQPKEFSCQKCFQQFTRKENYDEHMLKHRGLRVLCNLCQKTFCSWKSFKLHKKLHNFTRTVYFCEHCSAIFMFKSNLQRHLRLCQNVKNVVVCSVCNLTVKSEESLMKHRSQPIKRCVLCSQPFCLESHLRKHRKIFHPEIWFKCKLCDLGVIFTARSEHHLRDHVKKAHDLVLTFMECYEEGWFVNFA